MFIYVIYVYVTISKYPGYSTIKFTIHSRGLFIIDAAGTLRQITMNDLPVGRSVDETLRLVQAFQYTDEHGEVCPAEWKPGKETVSVILLRIWHRIVGVSYGELEMHPERADLGHSSSLYDV